MSAEVLTGPSYQAAVSRFDTADVAANYPSRFRATSRDRRELTCILKALANVPSGSKVLDLPCGTGRLTSVLVERGFEVIGADSSPNMVGHAQRNWDDQQSAGDVQFQVADVMNTGFADRQFDAVICNRLFHHFYEPATRREALRELGRICNGPLVVSFFHSFAVDAVRFRIHNALRRRTATDRVPIPLSTLREDVHAAGLNITRAVATRWGISPHWYVVLERNRAHSA